MSITARLAASSLFALGAVLAACGQGPAEKSGEAADSAYERATQGEPNPMEGPLERAGERLDETGRTTGEAAERIGNEAQEGANAAKRAAEEPAPPPPSTPY